MIGYLPDMTHTSFLVGIGDGDIGATWLRRISQETLALARLLHQLDRILGRDISKEVAHAFFQEDQSLFEPFASKFPKESQNPAKMFDFDFIHLAKQFMNEKTRQSQVGALIFAI